MRYENDKSGSKFLFIALFIIVLYLAFFNFDLRAAYTFTVANALSSLRLFWPGI